jgi:hypothetical protein
MRKVCNVSPSDRNQRLVHSRAQTAADEPDAVGLGKFFSDPNILGKLASNPRTQKHLADPAFVQKVLK